MNDDTVGGLSTPERLDMINGTPLRQAGPRGRRTVVAAATVFDPPGRQKVEALGVLKSFPSLEKQLSLETDDDVRRSVFEGLSSEGPCSLDYADDVEPWIGDRAAVAVVDQARPEPVVVLQVEDADDGTLADDREFQELTGDADEPGVVTLYAAPEAGPALVEAIDRDPAAYFFAMPLLGGLDPLGSMLGPVFAFGMVSPGFEGEPDFEGDSSIEEMPPPSAEQRELDERFEHLDAELEDDEFDDFPEPELPARLRQSLMDFSGLGGVVRFQDGGVELEMVTDRLEGRLANVPDGEAGDDVMAELPDDTAIAFGAGLADVWVNRMVGHLSGQFAFLGTSQAELIADVERDTGLDVPGDVEDLVGDSVGLAVGAGFDPDQLYMGPGQPNIAARITGDPDEVEAALTKLRAALPPCDAKLLLSRRVGDDVLVSGNPEYLDELAEGGNLADTGRFRDVVPDGGDATSVFFVNFDAGDWLVNMMGSASDRKDAEPLEALGYTTWADGDRERTLVRLSVED